MVHPVITLLVSRMESHPEEFVDASDSRGNELVFSTADRNRWAGILNRVLQYATEADKEVLNTTYHKIKMDHLHTLVMDELLNGDGRRARENQAQQVGALQAQQTQQALLMRNSGLLNTLSTKIGL